MTGTGALSEDVAGASFDLEMTGAIGKLVSCQGDASFDLEMTGAIGKLVSCK